MKVIKRDGREAEFNEKKIYNAIKKASDAMEKTDEKLSDEKIRDILDYVVYKCQKMNRAINVEEIQDLVETQLMASGNFELAKKYVKYRYKRQLARKANSTDDIIISLVNMENEEAKQENSNKNPIIASTQRDYIAGEVSRDLTTRLLLPKDVVEEHKSGAAHFHDSDYFIQRIHNCDLINLEDMLENGTVITGTQISRPHSLRTASNITTQIIAQVSSNQYGGQTFSLAHLAPFVDVSRRKIRKEIEEEDKMNDEYTPSDPEYAEKVERKVKVRLKREIRDAIQTIQYQLVTLMTTNGQAPFVSMFMYLNETEDERTKKDLALLIEEVFKQRIEGLPNEKGVPVTPAFPKLLYVLDDNNITPDSEYYYLTELAAKCIAKRMTPDCISAKIMKELKGDVYPCMGCRSFLTPDRFTDAGVGNIAKAKNYDPKKHKYYGRFNQGVYTLNLVDIACASGRDMDKFWKIFEEKLEIAHKALRCRHERLKGTVSDIAPILWQNGALARLEKGETIDKLLYDGYSTISLGYAGLYECCMYMTGKSHTDPNAKPFAIKVMKKMNDACSKWKYEENIDYSLYGTPLESTTYKFAKALQKKYGIIPDVTNHNYITNSYHVNVREHINAFDKLKFEAEFQRLSPGGCISYVEVPNMQHNIPAVIAVMKYIYENIMYAELNTKSDYCEVCGFDGEIQVVKDNGKLVWECPNCKNRDQSKMYVARRTCGYIGTQYWNQGRTEEISQRVLHL